MRYRYLAIILLLLTACGPRMPPYSWYKPTQEQFFEAVRGESTSKVADLIAKGADIEAPSPNGDRPLHLAISAGRTGIAHYLLSEGAEINSRGFGGNTALHYAMIMTKRPFIRKLVEQGADVNAHNQLGETPMFVALRYNRPEIVDMLIRSGANINHQDNNGQTVLHHTSNEMLMFYTGMQSSARGIAQINTSTWDRYAYILKMLLKNGADPSIRDYNDMTVLDLAAQKGHKEAMKVLLPFFEAEEIRELRRGANTEIESTKEKETEEETEEEK